MEQLAEEGRKEFESTIVAFKVENGLDPGRPDGEKVPNAVSSHGLRI